jgi:hypothetical protein
MMSLIEDPLTSMFITLACLESIDDDLDTCDVQIVRKNLMSKNTSKIYA